MFPVLIITRSFFQPNTAPTVNTNVIQFDDHALVLNAEAALAKARVEGRMGADSITLVRLF